MNHARLYDIMSGQAKDPAAAATRLGLTLLAPGYHLAIATRNKCFDLGIKKSVKLDRPVISVGNITTGGTGKTPMVIELARRLLAQNQKPAVLMRGYMAGGKQAQSDEAQEITRALGDQVPVMPDPDRVQGAKRILEAHPKTTVFLLDDGFQHRRVVRDLNIVLIDATRPFGFNHLLPRGLLREPIRTLKRADAIIITRCDQVAAETLTDLGQQIIAITGNPPLAHTTTTWSGYRTAEVKKEVKKVSGTFFAPGTETGSDTIFPANHLADKKVVAACAIGNPAAFQHMLDEAAAEVLHIDAFDDHHTYTPGDIQHILKFAKQQNADAVVTTEKDWVKWADLLKDQIPNPPILRPTICINFQEGAEVINDSFKTIFSHR